MSKDLIEIKGARVHNLKNVHVNIPRNKLIVVTGVSGSGKSSLTIDTLFAEGQRRYAESLSAYARQFMQRINKPDVDDIKGLCPAIAIEQKVTTRTPRSTVGSMTEIYDYLRLLFARVGKTYSPISGQLVKKEDVQDVVNYINTLANGDKIFILTPLQVGKHRNVKEELNILLQKGFARIYQNGVTLAIEDVIENEKLLTSPAKNAIYILIDRLVKKEFEEEDLHRLTDSIGTAFYEGDGIVTIDVNNAKQKKFNNKFEADGMLFEEPIPNLFSFNNPYGACPTCEGFSQILGLDKDLIIPNPTLTLFEGAVAPWKGEKLGWWKDQFIAGAKDIGYPIHKPIIDLTPAEAALLWQGKGRVLGIYEFFKEVESNLYKIQYRVLLSRYRGKTECTSCNGYRLRKEALYVKIADKHIGELCHMPVKDVALWFTKLKLNPHDAKIATRILIEINNRFKTLLDVGLGYLTLSRLANSLSGGESQRIQLTRSLGSNLTNSLYILDEPSIGLHSKDTERLITVLKELRNLGNTVVVVEHDEQMMRAADHIIDMGPLASHLGGQVIAEGNYNAIIKNPNSLTGKYLNGTYTIERSAPQRKSKMQITVVEARQNNLKNVTVSFPLAKITAVAGPSGSGKTTLVKQILYPALQKLKGEFTDRPGIHKAITGDVDSVSQIEMVDQNPIGKSSRSNPVTYIKAYDEIRDLFAEQPLSKIRGFEPKHFSFNVDAGRCDTCKGDGVQVVEMQFLADVELICEQCNGKKFKEEVLEVRYNEKNIFDILELSVDEAIDFFKTETVLVRKLQPLADVGLGYVKLGQSSNTLSGGEAQRVKLASFLGKGKAQGQILFIFDEPTSGLHFNDIKKLLASFNALVNQGHTIIVIEHNTDVIKNADWVIELGPEAGENGGHVVFEGTPEKLKKENKTNTAKFL
jgi:excinuclease ABC subunit A